jgi:acyl transferase domain-containing protein/phosphopantetheinyl transferase
MRDQPPIAIVGMAVLLPGAPDLESYWQNLISGVDSIIEVPAHRWDTSLYHPDAAIGPARADRIYCRRGGFIDGLAEIDPTEFGIMPNSVAGTEPDQLIALRVAASAIADAGGTERLPARDRIGVILGRGGYPTPALVRLQQRVRTAHQLVRTLSELVPDLTPEQLDQVKTAFTERLGPHEPESAIGLVPNLAASRIANRLDLRGPAYTVDAACASALIAVDQAVGELTGRRCDVVLAGGVHHCHDITLWSVFAQLRALSPSQRIRPFDRAADGLLIGEGTGVVVLKRLADAERDGDRIYAVIRGTGVASDGRGASLFNPESDGQVLALQRAWRAAGLDPAEPGSLGLLEAHGTATPVGDLAELATLERVFGQPTGGGRAVIGSVKSMIGHTMPAAGIAGLVKAALAVHRGVLLPTLGCEDPHPALARTQFRPIGVAEPWELGAVQRTRRAAVNAFGFGGINAHVVLEQHPSRSDPLPPRRSVAVNEPEQVLHVTAATPDELAELLDRDNVAVRALGTPESGVDGCRLGVVDPTPKRLAVARRVVAKGTAWRGRNDVWFSPQPLLRAQPVPRIGFVFPGLEAEFSPRVDDVARHFGLPRPDTSAETLGRHAAAVVAVGRLLDRALRRLQIVPGAVAGHSIGEWAAMSSAGMYADAEANQFLRSFDLDALRVPDVVFAALGCGADRVVDAIADHEQIVVSHDNSPNQSIVCGPAAAIDQLVRAFRGQNVLGQVLPFRSGFHTPMVEPYLTSIREFARRIRLHPPTVPIWSATSGARYPEDEAELRTLLVRHLLEPVRFRQVVEAMYADGVRVFVQVGPGQLGMLIDDTLHGRKHLTVAANSPHRSGLDQLRRVVTALWVEGGAPRSVDAPPSGFAAASPKQGRRPVTLDLSGALISLHGAAPLLVQSPGLRAAQEPSAISGLAASLSRLDQFAAQSSLVAEFAELLADTADTAVAVIDAGSPATPRTAAVHPPAQPAAPRELDTVLRISTETMPYLRDHCFFRQREDWPDETDRWPIVPAATLIQHMIDVAERAAPGRHAVAVHEVRLNRWLVASPPVDVSVTAVPEGPDRVRVSVGQYCQAVIELGERFPSDPPLSRPRDTSPERTPGITAEELYRQRWMFHGPQFQGVTELTAVGDQHVRGVIMTPAAPGGLLDNVGQLLGYWLKSAQPAKPVLFPWRIRHLRFFGPHPAPGTSLDCLVRIRSVTDTTVEADMELTHNGRLWARCEGWQDHRFEIDQDADAVTRFPEERTLSRFRPGGWALLFERWSGVASSDLVMRIHLSAVERADYDRCSPRVRRQWLLGRIALKDAVRRWLRDHGYGPVFPAEVRVFNDERGRPRVSGQHGRTLPSIDVSLAHCHQVAVAIARPRTITDGPGVGIDIEEIAERDGRAQDFALSREETDLLAARCAETGEPKALWFTRFWTAKEAVSKAEDTGLGGRPKRFAVVKASRTALEVQVRPDEGNEGPARTYGVRCEQLHNPKDLPARHYVVSWTVAPDIEQEEME